NGELVFLHQMQAGPADRSYGVHVAKLAGLPDSLLKNAAQILANLEQEGQRSPQPHTQSQATEVAESQEEILEEKTTDPQADQQLSLFSEPDPTTTPVDAKVVGELKNANLMAMTPMEVMNAVYKWQSRLNKKK
ncbi:MAG TPA: DNA mismatch repair protein MutS, partial [Candidatus Ligilactobacillus excrementavium]|nr:DNA mismatch repair protein MutS [Candidatus Ligilactobacillus excrementavium]